MAEEKETEKDSTHSFEEIMEIYPDIPRKVIMKLYRKYKGKIGPILDELNGYQPNEFIANHNKPSSNELAAKQSSQELSINNKIGTNHGTLINNNGSMESNKFQIKNKIIKKREKSQDVVLEIKKIVIDASLLHQILYSLMIIYSLSDVAEQQRIHRILSSVKQSTKQQSTKASLASVISPELISVLRGCDNNSNKKDIVKILWTVYRAMSKVESMHLTASRLRFINKPFIDWSRQNIFDLLKLCSGKDLGCKFMAKFATLRVSGKSFIDQNLTAIREMIKEGQNGLEDNDSKQIEKLIWFSHDLYSYLNNV